MTEFTTLATRVLERCDLLATMSEERGRLTRTCLSAPMRQVHDTLRQWMHHVGMTVQVDGVGNLIGMYPACQPDAPTLVIGSHLDTVPDAGRYDGVLGVLLGLAVVEALGGRHLSFAIQVVGFSDEEGVRFHQPFLGSRGYIGDFPPDWLFLKDQQGQTFQQALHAFGLNSAVVPIPASVPPQVIGYLEFHIEQGPVLEEQGLPVGVVEAIVGATRADVIFRGIAGHAGTTPMSVRRDALAGASAFILAAEALARQTPGLVATVGQVAVAPGASNVIPGETWLSLDMRHADDAVRRASVAILTETAHRIAQERGLDVNWTTVSDIPAVQLDAQLVALLETAVHDVGLPAMRLVSGAGHDAMVVARRMPAAMLFLRCRGGVSHHPAEHVEAADVAVALQVGLAFLERLERLRGILRPV